MPALEAPSTLAVIDKQLETVSREIHCHLAGDKTRISWTECWRLADRLLDQRLSTTLGR